MTPQERLRIFKQEQQGRTAEERRRVFFEEEARRRQPPPERSASAAFGGGLAEAGGDLVSSALSLYQAGKSAVSGDFTPAKELAESVGRGALKFVSAFDPAGNAYAPTAAEQDPRLAELQRRRMAREGQTAAGRYVQRRNAQLAVEAEQDTSTTNRVARGAGRLVGSAAPAVVTGVLTGGSVPAMAATSAIQSAGQPENVIPSTVLGAAPVPVGQAFRAGVNAVRRAFGKGAAQIIEAEALPAATAQVRQSIGEVPPVVGEAISPAGSANPTVQRAIQQFEEAVQRINASDLPPNLKAAEMKAAIAEIGREARGIPPSPPGESMVQTRFPKQILSPPPMRLPDEPLGAVTGFTEPPTAPISSAPAPQSPLPSGRAVTVGDKTYRLTPEQEARWVAEVDEPLANAARRAQGFGPEDAAKIRKGSAMRIAAVKRQIVGSLTPKEEAAIAAREATNYRGKPVLVDGQPGTVIGNPFGKVRVRLDDGSEITVAPSQVGPRGSSPVQAMNAPTGPPRLEADLGPQGFGVRAAPDAPFSETSGPSMGEALGMSAAGERASVTGPSTSANLDLDAALASATASVPRPIAQRVKDELLGAIGALKSIKSTGDISAPFRQGALLMLRPLQWRQAGRAWANQFKAFKTKNFDEINQAIASHPDAQVMDDAGLYLANRTKEGVSQGEEAFLRRSGSKISETVSKTPGIKNFEQMYTTFLDTQRVERFAQFKRAIDKAGLSPEDAQKSYKAAAEWINIATGRGSLGQRFDKSFEALNFFLFSPRYVASRLNVFNPAMYIRNAATPGGRAVLKGQMADLMQFAGTVASVMYMAKAAGADVGLNPNNPDFLKVRFGNWRYDALAGLQQVMRLIYRVGADIARAARGEKPKPGQTATDIAETFLSYKLSPPAAVFRDFIKQRTMDKKPFTAGRAVADLVAPMQWADFVEAYQKEGWGGVGKSLPGVVGIGSNLQEPRPVDAAIEKSQPLFSELQRLNKRVSELRKKDGEREEVFQQRVKQFGQNYTQFGLRLLQSPRFQAAPDNIKALALDRLNERAKTMTGREFAFLEIELDANTLMDAAESSKKNAGRK